MADAKPTPALTPAQQIRLESVSMTYRHDRPTDEVIKRATELSKFIEGSRAAKGKLAANGQQVEPEDDLI